ncbi:MAG: hypothetical protein SGI71_12005 [Verrucomicrobiota bacterium]|nr:hypothetical protein [Verrucomicrobiota bacterium]
MRSLIFKNWWAKMVSFFIALLIWVVIKGQLQKVVEREEVRQPLPQNTTPPNVGGTTKRK